MKLNTNTLTTYSGAAQLPAYSRAAVTPGIAHIGVGAFHRAHQAVYVDDCLAHAPDWGIRGISLRRPDTRDALAPQHGLYTLGVRDGSGLSARVIGALMSVDMGAQNAVRLIADKETRLVTITVTEKAYADTAPGSLAAILVQGLAERRQAGHGPITVLSCDNLLDNGARTAAIVQQGALAHGDLATWIDHNVSFPSSMVDRITPATTNADRQEIAQRFHLDDAWPVVTEPFSQWVIEDNFATVRPPFEEAGVQMVPDVAPFETMKLRLLNGAHTALALLGPMLGHKYVADAVADGQLSRFVTAMAHHEVMPTVPLPRDQLMQYWQALMDRFANPALNHALSQIASDSSQKVPVRLLPALLENLSAQRPSGALVLVVAAYVAHLRDAGRRAQNLADPRAADLLAIAAQPVADMVGAMAGRGMPLELLQARPGLLADITTTAARIEADGAASVLRAFGAGAS